MEKDFKRPTKRRLSSDERRQMIIDEAVRYFAEVGFSGPTRDLASRIGITQPLLYQYFSSKSELNEAVFARVYLDRLNPHWPALLADRTRPMRERLVQFYGEYTEAIFTYEWMRIFMFAGLAGEPLNRRYLEHVRDMLLNPVLAEMNERRGSNSPDIEDIWNLHGSIAYLGIRKFIYLLPVPDDHGPVVTRAIDRFLTEFNLQ
ncbi:AcrR Transcriptional regulator [Rhabdaerophilaceae bacterium]